MHAPLDISHLAIQGIPEAAWVDQYLTWPERPPVDEWAEANIFLDPLNNAEPGLINLDRTPHVREIVNAFADPYIDEIDLKFSTQIAKTTIILICLGYSIDQMQGPTLFVMPTELDAREMSDERIAGIIKSSPNLRSHQTGNPYDTTKLRYRFDEMILHMAWAGSASRLASKPKRFLYFDEINKYPAFIGDEADPIKLGTERSVTFWNRKIIKSSTPTVPGAYIDREYRKGDQRQYHVPCPHCGHFQTLKWPGIIFPDKKVESNWDNIKARRLCWYQCEACEGKIKDHHKQKMMLAGVWCSEGNEVDKNGRLKKIVIETTRRSYWINAIYSPWHTFSDIAYEFMESKNDTNTHRNFVNSKLAEEWTEETECIQINTDGIVNANIKMGYVPENTVVLLGGSDVQGSKGDHIHYVIRAWCDDGTSLLVEEGTVRSNKQQTDFDQLWDLIMCGTWQKSGGGDMRLRGMAMDRRWRTNEVDAFARREPERIFPVYGMGLSATKSVIPVTPTKVRYVDKRGKIRKGKPKPGDLRVFGLDTNYFKDIIARLIRDQQWHVPPDASGSYNKEIVAQHKIIIRDGNNIAIKEFWTAKAGFQACHKLDCEVYDTGLAEIIGYFAMMNRGPVKAPKPKPKRKALTTPGGRAFVATER